MTINGIDIASFEATLMSKQITNHDVVQIYDWLDGAPSPVFSRTEQRFKDITLTILIETNSEAETESQFSALIRAMRDCTLVFDGFTKHFDCHFQGKAEPNRLTTHAWLVELELLCHKTYLPEVIVTANGVGMESITSLGVVASPCLVTVTPTAAIAEFVIQGFESEIRLRNLVANKPHVIDGYLYRYLKDGVNDITNYDAFAWPVLLVGTTNLVFSHSTANITVQYYPIYN
jgi:hypothetical protein